MPFLELLEVSVERRDRPFVRAAFPFLSQTQNLLLGLVLLLPRKPFALSFCILGLSFLVGLKSDYGFVEFFHVLIRFQSLALLARIIVLDLLLKVIQNRLVLFFLLFIFFLPLSSFVLNPNCVLNQGVPRCMNDLILVTLLLKSQAFLKLRGILIISGSFYVLSRS